MNLMNTKQCKCGKAHTFDSEVITGKGAINQLSQIVKKFNAKKVFVIADKNTFSAAGEKTYKMLEENEIKVFNYIFKNDCLEPNEENVGLAIMNFNPSCDVVVGVGSGVINELLTLKKPMLLIPLSKACSRGDQIENAKLFEEMKIALMLQEEDCNEQNLLKKLDNLIKNCEKIKKNMILTQNFNACDKIIEQLEKIKKKN